MEYTIREMIARKGLALEDTDYRDSNAEMLDFRLFSGDFYEPENGKLRFKDCVTVMDFPQVSEVFPTFARLSHKGREKFPYFVGNADGLLAARERGEPIAVEGGPCLFGEHEVSVSVRLSDGETRLFDYATGKTYFNEQSYVHGKGDAPDDAEPDGLAEYLRRVGERVEEIAFRQEKWALTPQEYLNLRYAFELAAALGGPLVVPIPDMSYRKYLVTALEFVAPKLRENALADFDAILFSISDLFLDAINKLQAHFQIKPFACVHLRDADAVNLWYERRAPYIERGKVLRSLTRISEKIEPIKDYISMPALPLYLFDSRNILQADSVDETDSYRKCKKAHKNAANMGCVMIPELLSGDGVHTIYNAPLRWKDFGNYDDTFSGEA